MLASGKEPTYRTIVAMAAICFCASSVVAGPFSQLVVFGDSLSDIGNIADATLGIYPGRYYFDDRFSNGPVFVEALSEGLGLGAPLPSTDGGNNFAYGGARTFGTGGFEGLFIRDVDEQVDQFLATRTADLGALFLVYAGSNDLVGGETNVNIPAGSLAEDIGRLAAAGARHFLVPSLPPLGHTPRFNGSPATFSEYNQRAAEFNAAFDTMLDDLEMANSALQFFRLDVAALFSAAVADPAAFGLSNVTDAAAPGLLPGASSYNTSQIAPNAHEYLFWDDLHPTATVHAALAEQALALFVVPGDYSDDGTVDAADYVVWRKTEGLTGSGLAADGNGDEMVDALDYHLWRANFGNSVGAASLAATGARSASHASRLGEPTAAVPEPGGLWLLAAALSVIAASRQTTRREVLHVNARRE